MAMDFTKLKDGLAFDSESGAVGKIVGLNLISGEVIILVSEETLLAKLENVTFLEHLGFIGTEAVHNNDVIVDIKTDRYFEVVAVGNDKIQIHEINPKLERISSLSPMYKTDLSVFEGVATVIGNINELEPEEVGVDFNIKIVRDMTGGEFNGYYYACNNAKYEEVDLIKVVFIGSTLLEEEDYGRITLSHEEYLDMVAEGDLVESNPNELMNYVTGRQSFAQVDKQAYISDDNDFGEVEEEEEEEEEEKSYNDDDCDYCGESLERCDCDWDWE